MTDEERATPVPEAPDTAPPAAMTTDQVVDLLGEHYPDLPKPMLKMSIEFFNAITDAIKAIPRLADAQERLADAAERKNKNYEHDIWQRHHSVNE